MSTANVRVSPIRGTADAMRRHNIVLLAGEQGYETDTGLTKRGDGSTAWNSLPYDVTPTDVSDLAASVSATYATLAQLGALTTVDNGNGTATITATGTAAATDNGNGTATIAA